MQEETLSNFLFLWLFTKVLSMKIVQESVLEIGMYVLVALFTQADSVLPNLDGPLSVLVRTYLACDKCCSLIHWLLDTHAGNII